MIAIGDSHTWALKNHMKIFHIDNPTAHNIHKHEEKIFDHIEHTGINLFSFGEIDCRIHFFYQSQKTGIPILELMEITAKRYLEYVSKYICPCYILSVPPAGTQGNRFNYPYYAEYPVRKIIHATFNLVLSNYCKIYSIPFINYFENVVNENLGRKKEFVKDDIHLNEKVAPIILRRLK